MGYFEDFKGETTILLDGDRDGLSALADAVRLLEDRRAVPLAFHELPYVEPHTDVQLTAYAIGQELGVRRSAGDGNPRFTWHRSKEGWLEVAEKIDRVADCCGHHWLDAIGIEDAKVMVSSGEYDNKWWREHCDRSPE